MPALQVRDFPDELYEQLKAYAASQHRSVAQQTIVAVEQMLEAADAQHYWDGRELHRLERRPRYLDFDTEAERAARIEKRKALFAEIEKLPKVEVPADFPDTVELIRQGREERDAYIDAMIAGDMRKAAGA
ncbi:argininosuccinate lyase [Eggerthella guodeyinii]|uniref:Argininosuccinate lyase n=1 Tax=Eggerthella guodeyinii TaxID=2690837 RepID=A0A6L7IVV9_9ACTN|nr:argininosuccinate lyase [Eggerthella guodeyinii]QOS68946.1 argininosuccinate lyase [Eggerthella guodeyinii]